MVHHQQPSGERRTVTRRLERLVTVLLVVSLVPVLVGLGIPALARARGERLLLVISGSMEPAFAPGDVVRIRSLPTDDLRPGMVVTFRPPGSPTLQTHRIVSLRPLPSGEYVQTKGDANEDPDPNFTPVGDVIGQMQGDLGILGPFVASSQTPRGRALLFGTPLLLLAVAQILSFADRTRRHVELNLELDLELQLDEIELDIDLTDLAGIIDMTHAADPRDVTDTRDLTDVSAGVFHDQLTVTPG